MPPPPPDVAIARAKAKRGGHWRNHQVEMERRWHILVGLTNAYKYGRVSSDWGRSMQGRKVEKALQAKSAMLVEMVVDYFARLGQRGGKAKASEVKSPHFFHIQSRAPGASQTHRNPIKMCRASPTRPWRAADLQIPG